MKTNIHLTRQAYLPYASFTKMNHGAKYDIDDDPVLYGMDCSRAIASLYFSNYQQKYNLKSEKLLSFSSENDIEAKILPIKEWHNFMYDNNPDKFDIQGFDFEDKDYDFAFINQTFEHIVDPCSAIESLAKHLKSGGYIYGNWPVVNIRHMEPFHFFTGLTVSYINYLALYHDLEIIECGSWGNLNYLNQIFTNQTWPDYRQVSNLTNDCNCPCIGWGLYRKK